MQFRSFLTYIFTGCVLLTLTGCVKKVKRTKLDSVTIGMTKAAVLEKIGAPILTSTVKKEGNTVEVWKYVTKPIEDTNRTARIVFHTIMSLICILWIPAAIAIESAQNEPYWLCFSHDRLIQCGNPVEIMVAK